MSHPLSRRQAIQSGLTALAAGALTPPTLARADAASAAPPVATPPPPTLSPAAPRGMAAVTAQLSGVGVYIGNDWLDWDDNARRFAMAKIRAWGFDFVCPKVGGYARTGYQDEGQLRRWVDDAHGIGLGFAPFIYSIPETRVGDAQICAQIARVCGIANVDLEDEWGPKEKNAPQGYKGAEMAEFGRVYRAEAGDLPIIANGYGDPITRFGPAGTGFPNSEVAAWADAYSPQWYIGVYSRYKKGGVKAALDWGEDEVHQAMGAGFPLCPSVELASSFTPDKMLPLADVLLMMERLRGYNAPIFVWEYGQMTPAHAEALLGTPKIENVRLGRVRQDSITVTWDTHVPSRSLLTCPLPAGGPAKQSQSTALELTHTEAVGALTPGTSYPVTVQATSGGGTSPSVPLTVSTAPKEPGVFVQSALAVRDAQGRIAVTLLIANSAAQDLPGVSVTSLSVDGASILSPAVLPWDLGPLAHRDWQASTRDRSELSVIVSGLAPTASTFTLHVAGTATGGKDWTMVLPVALPA
jgi:hypothetical protein